VTVVEIVLWLILLGIFWSALRVAFGPVRSIDPEERRKQGLCPVCGYHPKHCVCPENQP